eukprot:6205225-Prorocentrum_lima.AAC.1
MTSSLVGSEMCIRDRKRNHPELVQTRKWWMQHYSRLQDLLHKEKPPSTSSRHQPMRDRTPNQDDSRP